MPSAFIEMPRRAARLSPPLDFLPARILGVFDNQLALRGFQFVEAAIEALEAVFSNG